MAPANRAREGARHSLKKVDMRRRRDPIERLMMQFQRPAIKVGHYDPGCLTAGAGGELAAELEAMGDCALQRAIRRDYERAES